MDGISRNRTNQIFLECKMDSLKKFEFFHLLKIKQILFYKV